MRTRILALTLLLALAFDADLWLRPRPQMLPPAGEPTIVLHDRAEVALENEPASFAETIHAALDAKRYDELEALAARLRDPDQRFRGGTSQIRRFYAVVTEYPMNPTESGCAGTDAAGFDAKRAQLEAWHAAVSDQPTATLALMQIWVRAGTHARGCAYAGDTSAEQWAAMKAHFEQAERYLATLNLDQDPEAYYSAIDMGMFDGWGRERLDRLYERAVKTFPTFYPLYAQHARMLQEKWYGETDELASYLDGLAQPERGAEGQIAYAFAAFELIQEYREAGPVGAGGLRFPKIIAAYQAREQRFGLRPHDWKALFFFSLRAGKGVTAHQAVTMMGRDWDSTIWPVRESFEEDIKTYKTYTYFPADVALLGG